MDGSVVYGSPVRPIHYTTVRLSILVFTRSFAACRERAAARRWSAPAQAVGPRRSAAAALVKLGLALALGLGLGLGLGFSPKP